MTQPVIPQPSAQPIAKHALPPGSQHLALPVVEFVRYTIAYRTGPDRLSADAFADATRPLRWVAYWYRSHETCAASSRCRCADHIFHGTRARFAGDGVALVAYEGAEYGLYSLEHGNDEAPLNWNDVRARHPTFTADELTAAREGPLTFLRADGSEEAAYPPAAAGIWAAVDAIAALHE
jgi:hypothetical protein